MPTAAPGPTITVSRNGPYVVTGNVPLAEQHIQINAAGESMEWREGRRLEHDATYKLCRCGHSRSKPFCDGSHQRVGFEGTEVAPRVGYDEQATVFEGPTLSLKDAQPLCAFARFCDPAGQVWNLVERTDEDRARSVFLHEAGHCPAGRLVAVDNATGKELEPQLPPSIGLVIDTAARVNGPIWVRGGIPVIAADGFAYEVRNRITLCRCGRSSNKPYCDGSHAAGA